MDGLGLGVNKGQCFHVSIQRSAASDFCELYWLLVSGSKAISFFQRRTYYVNVQPCESVVMAPLASRRFWQPVARNAGEAETSTGRFRRDLLTNKCLQSQRANCSSSPCCENIVSTRL